MRAPRIPPGPPGDAAPPRRLYLHEPGWKVGHKVGSTREFCSMMVPGQEYYHRLGDGELFLYNSEERLCIACAERRGLISYEPRVLREPMSPLDIEAPEGAAGIDIDVRGPGAGG